MMILRSTDWKFLRYNPSMQIDDVVPGAFIFQGVKHNGRCATRAAKFIDVNQNLVWFLDAAMQPVVSLSRASSRRLSDSNDTYQDPFSGMMKELSHAHAVENGLHDESELNKGEVGHVVNN